MKAKSALESNTGTVQKSLLVTGGAGFIGGNFVLYLLEQNPELRLINLDCLSYASDPDYIKSSNDFPNYKFIKGDIANRGLVEFIFTEYNIDGVIHLAAESHVDNSIEKPEVFVRTNVLGTFTLLDVAYKSWMDGPFVNKADKEQARFLHVSTDEVYGSLGNEGFFTESTPYAPNSPYSASKASSDFLVRSYQKTYGLNTITTNCSNNYGPGQHDEKLIPTIIRNAIRGNPIPIYGDGKNIRDWLYVEDHCRALHLSFLKGKSGENYNIGGKSELSNIELARKVCEILDQKAPKSDGKSYLEQIAFVKDRPGHDRRYAIDAAKIENSLGWQPKETFSSGIQKTIRWYLKKYKK